VYAELKSILDAKVAYIREAYVASIGEAVQRFSEEVYPLASETDAVALELDAAFASHRERILQLATTAGFLTSMARP
jgi:hypothetical protein